MLISVDLPPGVYRNGTDLDSKNRYRDANFVRWQNASLRPIGGWNIRASSAYAAPPRGSIAWNTQSDNVRIAAGTYNKLYSTNAGGVTIDITPAGLTAGSIDAPINLGFGGGNFGTGFYGIERPNDGVPTTCTTWDLGNWGQYLVACSSDDGKLYEWQLDTAGVAQQIANAPIDCTGLIVTDERFIFAFGAGGNEKKVSWCDRENNTDWTPQITNQAGDIELQTAGAIMCGVKVKSDTLILTNTDAHVATYLGPPTVYGFERVGGDCGAISRHTAVAVDDGAYWMGSKAFFVYNGTTVNEMACDVLDYIFSDINAAQQSKVFAVHNGRFSEVWWFYPSDASTENDRYVVYDYKENHWNIGQLDRTTGVDSGSFTTPVWFDSQGNIYNHEIAFSHDSAPFAETGPLLLGEGDQLMKVNKIIPDEKTQGEVSLSFKTRFYPNGTETQHGPYSMANPTSARFQGRQVRMRINGTELNDWRAGKMRLDVIAGSRR
jgi:hypothetical protein